MSKFSFVNTVYLDKKYINLISSKFEQFAWKDDNVANFRCPYCGDSKKDETKARGYLFVYNSEFEFKCHNCTKAKPFKWFLKDHGGHLFHEYKLEAMRLSTGFDDKEETKEPEQPKPTGVKDRFNKKPVKKSYPKELKVLSKQVSIADLSEDDLARAYLEERKIPERFFKRLFYTENYQEFINQIYPKKFKKPVKKDRRIIIPFFDENKIPFAFAGRSLDKNTDLRYITINESEKPLIYGLERIDLDKDIVYVVEGQFDSMFLDNCLAASGSGLSRLFSMNEESNFVFVYDNEPRSKDILKLMKKTIENNSGNKIVIWPKSLKYKDINSMVLNGYSPAEVTEIINTNTFSGPKAKLKLSEWSGYSFARLSKLAST